MRAALTASLALIALLLAPAAARAQDGEGSGPADALAAPSPSGDRPAPVAPAPPPPEGAPTDPEQMPAEGAEPSSAAPAAAGSASEVPPPPGAGEVPPPPPGYGGPTAAPPAPGATAQAAPPPADVQRLWAERQRLDEEIAVVETEYAEYSLGFPIVMLAVGGGLALGGGSGFILYGEELDRCFGDCSELETARVVTGVLAVGGVGLAILGLVNLLNRLSDRAPIRERLVELKERRKELDRQLEPWAHPVAGGAMAGLRATF